MSLPAPLPRATLVQAAMELRLTARRGENLLAVIREEVYRRSLPLATEHLRIVPSVSGEQSGVLGAAAMAIAHVLSPEAIEQASAELLAAADRRRVAQTGVASGARTPTTRRVAGDSAPLAVPVGE